MKTPNLAIEMLFKYTETLHQIISTAYFTLWVRHLNDEIDTSIRAVQFTFPENVNAFIAMCNKGREERGHLNKAF